MRRALPILVAVLLAQTAHATTYLDQRYGTPELSGAPRARGLGGAAAAMPTGAWALVDNPATLALMRGAGLQASGALLRVSENRFVPLFDTFDSYVDETAIAINDHTYAGVQGAGWARVPALGLVVAGGVFDRFDARYDYFDERRTTATTDELVAERTIETRGVVRSAGFGAALTLFPGAAIGAAVHRYFGTLEQRDVLAPRAAGATARVLGAERELAGTSVVVGGLVSVGDRLRAGVAWENGVRLDGDARAWQDETTLAAGDASATLPWRLQMGGSYRPRNTLRTTFAMDAVFVPWSEIEDALAPDLALEDTWDLRFGLEHVYYHGLPARLGFRYVRAYAQDEADLAALTLGLGYAVAPFGLDLAAEIGKRNSRQDPLWSRDEQGPAVGAGRDRVEDTVVRITLGAQLGF